MNTGVYIIYHVYNPTKFYVGSTSSLGFTRRFNNHLNDLKNNRHNNKHLQRISNKYGIDGFRFKILQEYLPEYCIGAEQFWIDKLDACNNGYNQSKKAGFVSMPFDERRNATKSQQKTIIQIDINNNIVSKYTGLLEASRRSGVSYSDISYCCNRSKTKMAGGYFWCFDNDYSSDIKYTVKYHNAGISQYSKDGIFIKKWKSIKEAALEYSKGNIGNIVKCCNTTIPTAYGYIWKYN